MYKAMAKIANAMFEVENLTIKINCALCKVELHNLLLQQVFHKALDEVRKKLIGMTYLDWEDLDEQALSIIRFCLKDEVLFNIVEET